MKPDSERDVSVNRKALRELLVKSFSNEELNDFCFDYFPDVYERAEGSFGKHVVARLLIDFCQRRGLIKYLISQIKEHNSYQYSLFEDELFKPAPPPLPSPEEPKTTLKLTFPNLNLADFTPEKQAALIQLIAEELNIPEEDVTILEIREGSVIITMHLPASAARQLIALYHAGHPVLQDLRLGNVERIPLRLSAWQRIIKFLSRLSGSSNSLLILIVGAILLTGLATIPVTVSLRLMAPQKATPTFISQFVFVTPTNAPPLPTAPPGSTPAPTIETTTLPLPTQMPAPLPPVTSTPLPTSTAPLVPRATERPTETSAPTSTPVPTNTPIPTSTETFTVTPTASAKPPLGTSTPSPTPTPTKTLSTSPIPTPSRTHTPASTPPLDGNQVGVEGPVQVQGEQLFTVAIAVRDIVPPGVFGAQFNLTYQPTDLAIVEITPNPELLVPVRFFDNEVGLMDFAASRREEVPNFTEDVIFVSVTFEAQAVTETVTTTIELQNLKLGAKGGIDVTASGQDLRLEIRP